VLGWHGVSVCCLCSIVEEREGSEGFSFPSFNDESSFSLNETLLQEFGSVNTDEEIDKLFQMIGTALELNFFFNFPA
jgi:hypothetical protein